MSRLRSLNPGSSRRQVLSRDEASSIGHKLLELTSAKTLGICVEHVFRAVTKVSDGHVRAVDRGDRVQITFDSSCGSGIPVTISTNQVDDTTLRSIVREVERMMPPKPPANEIEPDDPDDPAHFTYNPRPYLPVKLWHESTAQAMHTATEDILPQLITRLRTEASGASPLRGTATVGFAARSVMYVYRYGMTAFAEETDAEVTLTARTPDGTGSGWSGQAHRDWSQMTPRAIVPHAAELARRSRGPVALEPGRRVAILGPAAIAQLVLHMAPYFEEARVYPIGDNQTPFTNLKHKKDGRLTKRGERVFDPRLMMMSDPADPLGGYPPFFERRGIETGVHGYPVSARTWIDRGVLANFAYNVSSGLSRQIAPCDTPKSIRVMAAPGTATATIEEMIAKCREGVYVNRFTDVSLIDTREGRNTGLLTGATRDGCFLVKDGKIDRPIKNFRFIDSPFFAFNRVEMLGTPERVAFGYDASGGFERGGRWPRLPVIVPPMMIQDFNFTALTDAV
jgi:predicted Zn-dependent protease